MSLVLLVSAGVAGSGAVLGVVTLGFWVLGVWLFSSSAQAAGSGFSRKSAKEMSKPAFLHNPANRMMRRESKPTEKRSESGRMEVLGRRFCSSSITSSAVMGGCDVSTAGRLLIPMSPSDQSKGGKCGFDLFDTPRNREDCRHAERRDRRRIQFENMVFPYRRETWPQGR